MVRRFVLWDIDGTLVDASGFGRDAFGDAFRAVFGRELRDFVPMAGRTDHAIALEVFELNGVRDGEGHLTAFSDALEAALAGKVDLIRERGRALPGAAEAIEALSREPGVLQSLLTGNIAPNAAVKLAAFGLERHLDLEVGGYGSDHRLRHNLVDLARAKAERKRGVRFGPEDTVLVGDTPLDVAAGRDGGARVVAVASGGSDMAELERAGAHDVLPDLRDTAAVVAAVLGGRSAGAP